MNVEAWQKIILTKNNLFVGFKKELKKVFTSNISIDIPELPPVAAIAGESLRFEISDIERTIIDSA